MATRYWMVSLPVQPYATSSTVWAQLQDSISKHSFDTPLYRFNVPTLRVGTLDSLLSLADDLLKANVFVEGATHKIRRQIDELERLSGVDAGSLTVEGVPIDSYLTRFVWDEAKYPIMSPLKETIDSIHSFVAKVEDELKESMRSSLLQWCYSSYGEVFSSWMHFSAVRVFTESILRYGLPPSFLACVLAPSQKSEKKVRSILDRLCDSANSMHWKSEEEVGVMAGLAGKADTYPYVSFTINLV